MTQTDGGWYVMDTFFVASFFETWLWTCGMAERKSGSNECKMDSKSPTKDASGASLRVSVTNIGEVGR